MRFWHGSTLGLLLTLVAFSAVGAPAKRVLVIHSFGSAAPPFTTHSIAFETTLTEEMGEPVDLDEISLDTARYGQPEMQEAFVEFLQKRLRTWQPDLVVPIGSPAGVFVAQYRDRIFPSTPIIYAGMDRRRLPPGTLEKNAAFVGESFDLPGMVDDMLQLEPATTNVVVVIGASPVERYWTEAFRSEWAPFTNRVSFTWLNNDSYEEMLQKVAHTPPRSFIFLILLLRDAKGVTINADEALKGIHAVANAPVNSIFQHQLGMGIVGGRLYQAELEGVESARIAVRILHGEPASSFPPQIVGPLSPRYDGRELQRWKISESQLPAGSVVLFREPTLWERYGRLILGILFIVVLEAGLILLLVVNLVKRQQVEKLLRESEERLALATDSAGTGLWSMELDTSRVWATERIRELFEFAPDEELTYDSLMAKIHPEDREKVRQAVQESLQQRQSLRVEYRVLLSNGNLRWLVARGHPHFNASGEPDRLMGAAVEITYRKEAEKALRESEERFRIVADSAPVLIWMSGLDKLCTFFNRPWMDFTGRTTEQEMGNGWTEGVHPDDRPGCLKTFVESFEARQPFVMQYRLRRHDGEYRWILDNGVPRYDVQGNFAGYIGSCIDITDRRLAEERMQLDAAVLGNMTDGVILVRNSDQIIVHTNLTFDRMFGYEPGELIGQHIDVINAAQGRDAQAITKTIVQALRNTGRWHGEVLNRRKDGAKIHCRVSITSFQHPTYGEVGVSIHTDITEQRQNEEEMRRLRIQSWHADRVARTGAITSSLAHELNQPLAAVLSNAQAALRFLERENPDLDEIREILGDIVHDDKRAGSVISGLRSMLRRQETKRERISLAETIRETMELLHSELLGRHVDARIRCESDCLVLADKAQIQQVLLNLMMNSAEAMQDQPVNRRRVEVMLSRPKTDTAQVAVRDSGPGITDEESGNLFDAFWTTKAQGLGIGLPICRSIIESHGGRIWFANNDAGGATFYFTLPVETVAPLGRQRTLRKPGSETSDTDGES